MAVFSARYRYTRKHALTALYSKTRKKMGTIMTRGGRAGVYIWSSNARPDLSALVSPPYVATTRAQQMGGIYGALGFWGFGREGKKKQGKKKAIK